MAFDYGAKRSSVARRDKDRKVKKSKAASSTGAAPVRKGLAPGLSAARIPGFMGGGAGQANVATAMPGAAPVPSAMPPNPAPARTPVPKAKRGAPGRAVAPAGSALYGG